jgi:hypothetical protein
MRVGTTRRREQQPRETTSAPPTTKPATHAHQPNANAESHGGGHDEATNGAPRDSTYILTVKAAIAAPQPMPHTATSTEVDDHDAVAPQPNMPHIETKQPPPDNRRPIPPRTIPPQAAPEQSHQSHTRTTGAFSLSAGCVPPPTSTTWMFA